MRMQKTSSLKNIRKSYNFYRKKNKDKNFVPIKEYLAISAMYMKFLLDETLDGNEVSLPARMGTLKVVGKKIVPKFDENGKITNLSPNWSKTKELWENCIPCKEKKQLVFNTNEHSDGIRYRFFWSKKRVITENKIFYSLIMSRANKRALHKKIKEGQEYISNT